MVGLLSESKWGAVVWVCGGGGGGGGDLVVAGGVWGVAGGGGGGGGVGGGGSEVAWGEALEDSARCTDNKYEALQNCLK